MDRVSAETEVGKTIDERDPAVERVASGFAVPLGAMQRRAFPQPSIEWNLARIWSTVLGRNIARTDRSFLDYGGDSLAAMQVLARVREEFRVELCPAEFFASPTIADQARMIDAALGVYPAHDALLVGAV